MGPTGFGACAQNQSITAAPIEIRSRVKISPTEGGWYPWYEAVADPADSSKLIVCGSRWDARDNALYGFVRSSSDGGMTWHTALEDKSSAWVSEQSCAMSR